MADETYTAFFYGTLMAFPVLSRVIYGTHTPDQWQRDRLKIRPALLYDHCRYRVREVDYPGVVPAKGKSVRGTIVEGLSEMDVSRLDVFEGSEYERREVEVQIGDDGQRIKAQTYIYIEGSQYLEDTEWDFEQFKKDKLKRWVGDVKNFEFEEIQAKDPLGGRWWRAEAPTADEIKKAQES